jgi:anti-sigma factor RsiW
MRPPMSKPCPAWETRLAAAHLGDLAPAERAALEEHLASCPACAALLARYERMDSQIRQTPALAPLADLPPQLLALWAEEDQRAETTGSLRPIRSARKQTSSPMSAPLRPVPISAEHKQRPRRLISTVAALVAVLIVALLITALVASRLHSGAPTGNPGPSVTTAPTTASAVTATSTPAGYVVQVYFAHHPESDNDPTAVFAVQRISPTLGVATFALNQLLLGPTAAERAQGYYSPFDGALGSTNYCSGNQNFLLTLDHRGSKPETGTATVQFCRTVSIAGDLDGGRMKAIISKTLLQFANIKAVAILNHDGNCFDDLMGGNRCLNG